MGFVDDIGNKKPGFLIMSKDWNALVEAVNANNTAINQRVDALSNVVEEVRGELSALGTDIAGLQSFVTRFTEQYFQLDISTTKVNYAIGELAELTVQVKNFEGESLSFENNNRPWVDLVTSWGQFKPVAGFSSRGGVGDRTLSVQVNASGQAKVQIRSDYAEGLSEEDDNEMSATLTTRPAETNKPIYDLILEASTPIEARPAYQVIDAEYAKSPRLRTYIDTHYLRSPVLKTATVIPAYRTRWRDYRATVMAFVKPDSNPTTPDASQGVSSLQVTFRDWIGPWIDYYIAPPFEPLPIDKYKDILKPKITANYNKSAELLQKELQGILAEKQGIVGKQRGYEIARLALEELPPPTEQPPFFNQLIKDAQSAIGIQKVISVGESASLGASTPEVAFDAFYEAKLQTGQAAIDTKQVIDGLAVANLAEIEKAKGELQLEFNNQLNTAKGELKIDQQKFQESIQADNGPIKQAIRAEIDPVRESVDTFRVLNPVELQAQTAKLRNFEIQLQEIQRDIPGLRQ